MTRPHCALARRASTARTSSSRSHAARACSSRSVRPSSTAPTPPSAPTRSSRRRCASVSRDGSTRSLPRLSPTVSSGDHHGFAGVPYVSVTTLSGSFATSPSRSPPAGSSRSSSSTATTRTASPSTRRSSRSADDLPADAIVYGVQLLGPAAAGAGSRSTSASASGSTRTSARRRRSWPSTRALVDLDAAVARVSRTFPAAPPRRSSPPSSSPGKGAPTARPARASGGPLRLDRRARPRATSSRSRTPASAFMEGVDGNVRAVPGAAVTALDAESVAALARARGPRLDDRGSRGRRDPARGDPGRRRAGAQRLGEPRPADEPAVRLRGGSVSGPGPQGEPWQSGVVEAADAVRKGVATPTELVRSVLARIDDVEPAVAAFVALDRDGALGRGEELTRQARAGDWQGPLHGVPVAIKDIFDIEGPPTGCGSRALCGRPAGRGRRRRRRAASVRRCGARRQDGHARARLRRLHAADAEPVGPRAQLRRLERRLGRGGRGRRRARRDRLRHGRLDPHPRRRLRHRRDQADLRPASAGGASRRSRGRSTTSARSRARSTTRRRLRGDRRSPTPGRVSPMRRIRLTPAPREPCSGPDRRRSDRVLAKRRGGVRGRVCRSRRRRRTARGGLDPRARGDAPARVRDRAGRGGVLPRRAPADECRADQPRLRPLFQAGASSRPATTCSLSDCAASSAPRSRERSTRTASTGSARRRCPSVRGASTTRRRDRRRRGADARGGRPDDRTLQSDGAASRVRSRWVSTSGLSPWACSSSAARSTIAR